MSWHANLPGSPGKKAVMVLRKWWISYWTAEFGGGKLLYMTCITWQNKVKLTVSTLPHLLKSLVGSIFVALGNRLALIS